MLGAGFNEVQEPMGYSKFAKDFQISSRTGMLLAYVPALCYCTWEVSTRPSDSTSPRWLAGVCLWVHFAKRTLEVMFLHVYSGRAALTVMAPIGLSYTMNSAIILNAAGSGAEPITLAESGLGLGLFALGQLGNLYHHYVLAALRRPKGPAAEEAVLDSTGRYALPTGGLFSLVTMPHYFCELVAWFGLVAAVPRLNILLVATGMTSYLAGRSAATTAWYKERFGAKWPASRKHLIPFIY